MFILCSLFLVVFTNGWEQKPYSLIRNWIPNPFASGMHAVFVGRFICLKLGEPRLINHIWTSPDLGTTGNISNSLFYFSPLLLPTLYMNIFISLWGKEWTEVPSQTFTREEKHYKVHSKLLDSKPLRQSVLASSVLRAQGVGEIKVEPDLKAGEANQYPQDKLRVR